MMKVLKDQEQSERIRILCQPKTEPLKVLVSIELQELLRKRATQNSMSLANYVRMHLIQAI